MRKYDEQDKLTFERINYHTDATGNVINQNLVNQETGEKYSDSHILYDNVDSKGIHSYQPADNFDKVSQDILDTKPDAAISRNENEKSRTIGSNDRLSSKSETEVQVSHTKSAKIGIKQDFEFRFNPDSFQKGKSNSNYLDGIAKALKNDDIPMYKIEGKDSNKIKEELSKRGVDSNKQNKSMSSDKPLNSASRVLYGKYFIQ